MRAVSATRLAITLLFQIILSSTVVSAFSFTFLNNPTQCSSLTVAVDGGTAPYRLNLIPAGPMPGGQAEIRVIVDEAFSEKTFKLNALKFPANSQFVAMVSDANGVGTGGTSSILTVSDSKNSSCLQKNNTIVEFFFFLNPDTFELCKPVNISWDRPTGDVTLAGVIPGGQSFQIPVPSGASSVSWTPQVEPNTSVLILAGDSLGRATGGSSSPRIVGQGSRTCLSGGAYSSTQSPYAGQVSSTSSPTPTGGSGNKTGINVPMVVGIVVGLLVLFAGAGALLYARRRKRHPTIYGNKTDLFRNDDNNSHEEHISNLEPTPFLSPPTNRNSEHASDPSLFENSRYRYSSSTFHSGGRNGSIAYAPSFNGHGRPPSSVGSRGAFSPPTIASTSIWDDSHTETGSHAPSLLELRTSAGLSVTNPDGGGPVVSGGSRKQPLPRARPVNFVLHQDAGVAGPAVHDEAELVELPPSYADVGRNSVASPPQGPTAALPPQ